MLDLWLGLCLEVFQVFDFLFFFLFCSINCLPERKAQKKVLIPHKYKNMLICLACTLLWMTSGGF